MSVLHIFIRDLDQMTPDVADAAVGAIRKYQRLKKELFIRDVENLSPEEAARAIEKILFHKNRNQPKRAVDADGRAAHGQPAVANPPHVEGLDGAALGVGGAQAGGEHLCKRFGVDTPQGHDFFAVIPVRVSVRVDQVGPVRPCGVGDVATHEVHIRLNVEGVFGEGNEDVQVNLRPVR